MSDVRERMRKYRAKLRSRARDEPKVASESSSANRSRTWREKQREAKRRKLREDVELFSNDEIEEESERGKNDDGIDESGSWNDGDSDCEEAEVSSVLRSCVSSISASASCSVSLPWVNAQPSTSSLTGTRMRRFREKKRQEHAFAQFHEVMNRKFFSDTLDAYCSVCERIWWSSRLTMLENDETRAENSVDKRKHIRRGWKNRETMVHFLREIGYEVGDKFYVCSTCRQSLQKRKVPTLATVNGFKYPLIPLHLPELSPIAARLISPRLPFMQIRKLAYFSGAQRLVGQVINVPVDVDTMARSLPRSLADDYVINVNLKRHLLNKSSYLLGCVSKREIKEWLRYLLDTPLYRKYAITVNEAFFANTPDYEDGDPRYCVDFVDETRQIQKAVKRHISNIRKGVSGEEIISTVQQTMFWSEDYQVHMAPGQFEKPLSLAFDLDAEELSFPAIYGGYPRQFTVPVTSFDMAKSEIRRRDRRGSKPEHILFMAAKTLRLRIIRSLSVMFRRNDDVGRITRSDLQSKEFVMATLNRNESFMKEIPNSIAYWHSRKNDLFAMIRQLGKPTVFLTLSASEIHWKPLVRYVYKHSQSLDDLDNATFDEVYASMSLTTKALLINNDPVLCCLYFDKLLTDILSALQKKSGPFGSRRVVEYFYRIEFQHRGSPHCHMLLWLDEAPVERECARRWVDGSGGAEVMPETAALVDELSTVINKKLPSERALQTHRHTHTCYKRNRNRCRFGAPFFPMDKTRIILPVDADSRDASLRERYAALHASLETGAFLDLNEFLLENLVDSMDEYINILRHGIRRPTVFHRRGVDDLWTTPFNPIISSVLQSNMDVQVILDEYSCAAYVAEYVNKSERGFSSLHKELIKLREEFPDMDYADHLKELSKRVLNTVEMCTQEAAWFLLQLKMSRASRDIQYVPTQHPSLRCLARKTRRQMDAENVADDSTDVWRLNLVQVYERRHEDLEDVCFADFVAWYSVRTGHCEFDDENQVLDDDYIRVRKKPYYRRQKPRVLRWMRYEPSKDPLNFQREMVTLFWPFRSEELEILDRDAYCVIFEQHKDVLVERRKAYDDGLVAERIASYVVDIETQSVAENDVPGETEGETPGPFVRTVEEEYLRASISGEHIEQNVNNADLDAVSRFSVVRKREDVMSHADYCAAMRCANPGQKKFLLEVINRLLYEVHKPLQCFLTGPAGSGKSYVIRLQSETANRMSPTAVPGKCASVVCATTGKAAVNIDGTTVHTAFNVSIGGRRKLPISESAMQTMRCDFSGVSTIIVDEVSMMGADLLNVVGGRLQAIGPDPTNLYGGFNVTMCGDLRQLPPVNASPVYRRPPNMLQDRMLWQNLDYYNLTEVVRQSDKTFSDILTKIGNGDFLEDEELALLETRFRTTEELDSLPELRSAIRLFHRNVDVNTYNTMILKQCDYIVSGAKDDIRGWTTHKQLESARTKLDSMEDMPTTGNLVSKLHLVFGKPYCLTQNLDKTDRLVNGAYGYLRFVERSEDNERIVRLWLEFMDPKAGKLARIKYQAHAHAYELPLTWTPLLQREAVIRLSSKITARRKQFPLMPANAVSIHKSQGATYDRVVYDYAKQHDIALVYVAMSRATSLNGLYLTNTLNHFTFYHCRKTKKKQVGGRQDLREEFNRLTRRPLRCLVDECENKLNEAGVLTSSTRDECGSDAISLAYMNVQSMKAHVSDVATYPVISKCTIVAVSETWMSDNEDPVELSGYKCVVRHNSGRNRAGGVAIYCSLFAKCLSVAAVEIDVSQVSFGDVCSARILYRGKFDTEHLLYLICMYVKPCISESNLMSFMGTVLWSFNCSMQNFHINQQNLLTHCPLLVCGDFNFEVQQSPRLLQYLHAIHGLELGTMGVTTTRFGTKIDAFFTKNTRTEVIPYISYFSVHRPLLAVVSGGISDTLRKKRTILQVGELDKDQQPSTSVSPCSSDIVDVSPVKRRSTVSSSSLWFGGQAGREGEEVEDIVNSSGSCDESLKSHHIL